MQVYDSSARETPVIFQLRAIFKNRDLLKLLVIRDLTVRYKRSVIGIWWSLLNPIFMTAVFYFIFNTVFKARFPDGTSFLPYILTGVLLMTFFNQGLTLGAESISNGATVLTKVYVRPEIFALSTGISSAINFLLGLIPLTIVLCFSHKTPTLKFPLIIIVVICMLAMTTGLSLILAVAYISFDDSKSIFALFLLGLQSMTPVFYPISVLGPHTRKVVELNPLTSSLQVARDVFGHNATASVRDWIFMVGVSIFFLFVGLIFFAKNWPKAVVKL